jgi:hypothetical protein
MPFVLFKQASNSTDVLRYPPQHFEGHGWFTGEVVSLHRGYYKVHYEDDDEEEYDEKQLAEILEVGDRKPPAKRRRLADRLNTGVEVSASIDSTTEERDEKELTEIHEVDDRKPPAKLR